MIIIECLVLCSFFQSEIVWGLRTHQMAVDENSGIQEDEQLIENGRELELSGN